MQDGVLTGARFAAAIEADKDTRRAAGDLGDAALHAKATVFDLSADDAETPENELRTHLVVDGESFSVADLLGSGMASTTGKNFVAEALTKIQEIRAEVDTLLGLDLNSGPQNQALDQQWSKVVAQLNTIFGAGNGDAYTGEYRADDGADPPVFTNAVGQRNPGEDDILDDIDEIIDALSSADAFAAATAKDGGVFKEAELSADDAAAAFGRAMSSATATLGVTGSTRYGTVRKTATDDAVTKLKYAPLDDNNTPDNAGDDTARIGQQGAFSYSTLQETLRTRHVVSTGNAYYTGGTHAISGSGTVYTGTMDVQVRFTSMTVSGLVSNFADADGNPWEYRYGDVQTIRLPEARLSSNARWAITRASDATTNLAQATFAARAGSPAPQSIAGGSTFHGILLGRGADSGSEASGTWSVGEKSDKSDYLAGAFGVIRGADVIPSLPPADDGSGAETSMVAMIGTGDAATAVGGASIKDGMLKLKVKEYGYTISRDTTTQLINNDLSSATGDGWVIQLTDPADTSSDPKTIDLNIGLAGLLSSGTKTSNSATHVATQVAAITKQRDQLAALQGLGTRIETSEAQAWQNVQDALFRVFGQVPPKLNKVYSEVKDEAVALIDDALDALASNANLDAALDPEGSGIFKGTTTNAASKVSNRTPANIRGEKQFQVLSKLGSTSYTRFGVWRMRRYRNAIRSSNGATQNRSRTDDSGADGPGMFAYSQLAATEIASTNDPSYQPGGTANFVGETVALLGTTYLSGDVAATVTWDRNAVGGALSVTFSNLANDNGDTLALETTDALDAGGVAIASRNNVAVATPAVYNVIRDVVFENIDVGTVDDELMFDGGTVGTSRIATGTFGARYRFANASEDDVDVSTAPSINGNFVGATVDGPLGLFGIWQLTNNTAVGIVNAAGNDVHGSTQAVAIYGAFGAEAP